MVSNNKAKVPKIQQRLNSPAKIKRVMQGELSLDLIHGVIIHTDESLSRGIGILNQILLFARCESLKE